MTTQFDPLFDEKLYLHIYPDVAAAILEGLFATPYAHFCECGKAEGRASNASQFVIEQAKQIVSLKVDLTQQAQVISDLNHQNVSSLEKIEFIYKSTSWRITAPMRYLSLTVRRVVRVVRLIPRIIDFGGGFFRSQRKMREVFVNEGWAGIKHRVNVVAGVRGVNHAGMITPDPLQLSVERNDYAEWVRRYDTLTEADRGNFEAEISGFKTRPLISVLMPTYNPPIEFLDEAIQSVRQQLYPNWELCIADDASTNPLVRELLERHAREDNRIKLVFREKNGHISNSSNSALEIAKGEFCTLLDHDDLLSAHALFYIALVINKKPDICLIYSDEDKVNEEGLRSEPYFKCDWNVDLFYSQNMFSHLGTYRTDLLRSIGGFRVGLEGSQDYDLVLRCIEKIDASLIHHIPRVLYHWRIHAESTAKSLSAKPYAVVAGERALNDHFEREKIQATAEHVGYGYRVSYALPDVLPLVSLIIPTRNGLDLIRTCIDSIIEKTTYKNYEILVIDNGTDEPATLEYLDYIKKEKEVIILRDDSPFNYSALNNKAVKASNGSIIGLLNNDLEVISPDWLSEMVSLALRPEIGAVGAKLLYPNDKLQHGGVILGLGGVAGHAHVAIQRDATGYFGRAVLAQNFSAVTAACMLIRKEVYEEVGGLNEVDLHVAFNDVDFCIRVRQKGYRNIWTPFAELYHYESATRGLDDTRKKKIRFATEVDYMRKTWGDLLSNDPAYTPNLTFEYGDFSLAWPPRLKKFDI
jgi:glycosyltransferase involved in cell wall biosynthesis